MVVQRLEGDDVAIDLLTGRRHGAKRAGLEPQLAVVAEHVRLTVADGPKGGHVTIDLRPGRRVGAPGALLQPQVPVAAEDDNLGR